MSSQGGALEPRDAALGRAIALSLPLLAGYRYIRMLRVEISELNLAPIQIVY